MKEKWDNMSPMAKVALVTLAANAVLFGSLNILMRIFG